MIDLTEFGPLVIINLVTGVISIDCSLVVNGDGVGHLIQEAKMLLKKFYKTKPTCQVTFQLPEVVEVQEVCVVGEFNDWDKTATRMKKIKKVWKAVVELENNREYQFRYLVNGAEWRNDDTADSYVPNHIDGDNSVVATFTE